MLPEKCDVLISVRDPSTGVVIQHIAQVSTNALHGRSQEEIEQIVSLYVREWIVSELEVQWQFASPDSFGLEFKPSEGG